METLITSMTSLEVTLVGVVILSWVAVAVAMISFGRVRRQELMIRDNMEDLRRALELSNSGLMGMGRKLLSIEKRMTGQKPTPTASKSSNVINLKERPTVQRESRYAQASTMIAQGLAVSQVAAATGMSQAEINLLAMLRRPHAAESIN